MENWRAAGHAKAEVTEQNIVADHGDGDLNADLTVYPGPLVYFGETSFSRPSEVRAERLEKIVGIPAGDIYAPDVLEKSVARLQGQFVPTSRLVEISESDEITVRIVLDGPALSPSLTLQSDPSFPEDEKLAQFLFGRELANICALQTIQLVSAVTTLTGLGGDGVLERIRRTAGVDDLVITSNDAGNASVSVGKYQSDNIYSDIQIDSKSNSVINLNLDLLPSTTLRGSVTSDGSSNIGLFFEKDY